MRRSTRICFLTNFLLLVCVAIFSSRVSFAAEATTAWRTEWEKTVKAAEEEGALVIYMTQSLEPVFRDSFQKKFPKIKVTLVTGRGPEISQRVMSERRAEKFAVDLYISGSTSPRIFHRAKMLEPVKPLLLLPEVVDASGWYEGKHHYNDPENRYIFVFEGTPRSGDITFNTKVVNACGDKILLGFARSEMEREDRLRRPTAARPDQRRRRSFSISTPISARNLSGGFTPRRRSRSCAPMSS